MPIAKGAELKPAQPVSHPQRPGAHRSEQGVGARLGCLGRFARKNHRAKHREGVVTGPRAIVLGVAQAVAILPGISRSGSTIATALLLGVSREQAARFSFLMVLPPIAGATLLELQEYSEAPAATGGSGMNLLVAAFLAAFVSGLIACSWMVKLVKRSKLSWFAVYCALAGATAIVVGLTS